MDGVSKVTTKKGNKQGDSLATRPQSKGTNEELDKL